MEAVPRASEDPVEERGTALPALRKARQRLPTPEARHHQAAREERLMARADALLQERGPEDWAEAEKQVKERCEAFPQLYRPLLTTETGEAERRRLYRAAYPILMETGDAHEAAERVREGEMKAERREALTGLALCPCPDCLQSRLAPNKDDPFGDPGFTSRNLQEQARPEAARGGDSAAVLTEIARVSQERGDAPVELLALSKLQRRGGINSERRARLQPLLDTCPLGEKARRGLEGERRLVLCDTNVLVALTLRALGATEWLGLRVRPEMLGPFDRLPAEGGVPAVSPAVRAEFLRRVTRPPTNGTEEEGAARVSAAQSVSGPLDLGRLLRREVRASGQHRGRVHRFLSREDVTRRSKRLTEAKVRANPERACKVVRRRQRGLADGPGEVRTVHMPDKGDQRLLAEATRLNELAIPGFSSVSILSDDQTN